MRYLSASSRARGCQSHGLEARSVEEEKGRTFSLIQEIGKFRIPDILRADLRSMVARLVHHASDPDGRFVQDCPFPHKIDD